MPVVRLVGALRPEAVMRARFQSSDKSRMHPAVASCQLNSVELALLGIKQRHPDTFGRTGPGSELDAALDEPRPEGWTYRPIHIR